MRDRLADYQEQYGDLYNLEATPAESTTYRFAKHDKEQYPDIITATRERHAVLHQLLATCPWATPMTSSAALDVQDELQTLYTSGTVFHAFLGEKLPDWQAAATLVRKIAENYKLPYYTMSPTYSVCKNHGYLAGEQFDLPHAAARTPRCTAASPATTARCRTGTTARRRSSPIVLSTTWGIRIW